MNIGKVLMTVQSLLEMGMGLIPNSLTVLEPGVDCRDFHLNMETRVAGSPKYTGMGLGW